MWQMLFPILGNLLDKILPNTEDANKAKAELLQMQVKGDLDALLGQLDINKEEAKSSSVFVSGWRPFCGWICGIALAYVAILEPIARFAASVWFAYTGAFPVIDTDLTMQVLLGMLGLAGARSFEKHKGVATK
jgi:small basic protein